MFAIRRCALRTLTQQPIHQLSSLRAITRVATPVQTGRASLLRSFHQSRLCLQTDAERAEASPAEAEANDETVLTEPSGAEESIKEESIATPDIVDAKPVPETFTEQAKDYASSAAQTISNAAASTASFAASNLNRGNRGWPGYAEGATPTTPSRILYVGNLFFEVTSEQLEGEFSRIGKVTNSRLVTDPSGMSKGFGYVEFATQESADRAIEELNQRSFQGRRMAVQYHIRRERRTDGRAPSSIVQAKNPPSKTLFIGNLSYQMSDRDLNDLFRDVRNVLDVRVAIDRRSGQPRGFAHADFIDVASAEKAKEFLSEKSAYGRQLRIDFSAQPNEGRTAGGSRRDE